MPITIDTSQTGTVLQVTVVGRVSDEDCARLMEVISSASGNGGRLRLMFDLTQFQGWNATIGWRLVHMKACGQVSRIALVGDKSSEQGSSRLCAPFLQADVRHFSDFEGPDAQQWLREPLREHLEARNDGAPRTRGPGREVLGRKMALVIPAS
jgi:hypothetical protein